MARPVTNACTSCHKPMAGAKMHKVGGALRCKAPHGCAAPGAAPAGEKPGAPPTEPAPTKRVTNRFVVAPAPTVSAAERTLPPPHVDSILDEPCVSAEDGGCAAAIGEPCAFAVAEPATWAHAGRFDRWADRADRDALRRRGIEDRICAELDRHAALPGDPPVPTIEGLVRALMIPADCDAFTLRDVVGAMCERGAIVLRGSGKDAYLRRAPDGAPIVMGRVGVVLAQKSAAPAAEPVETPVEHVASEAEPAPVDGWPFPPPADARPLSPRRFVEPDTAPGTPEAKRAARGPASDKDDEEPGFPELLAEALDDIRDTCAALHKAWNRSSVADAPRLRAELEQEKIAHMATRGKEATARADWATTCDERDAARRELAAEIDHSRTLVEQLSAERADHVKTREALTDAGAKAEAITAELRAENDRLAPRVAALEAEAVAANDVVVTSRAAIEALKSSVVSIAEETQLRSDRIDALRFGVSMLCEMLGAERPADTLDDAALVKALRDAIRASAAATLAEYEATHSDVLGRVSQSRSIETQLPAAQEPALPVPIAPITSVGPATGITSQYPGSPAPSTAAPRRLPRPPKPSDAATTNDTVF